MRSASNARSPARWINSCVCFIERYRRTDLGSAACLIFVRIVEESVLWNDLNKRKSFSGKDTAGEFTALDKWFDDNFVCVVNIEGFVDCIVIFFFCVADVYTDTRSVRAWFYNQWKIVTKLVQRGIFSLRCQGSSSWSRNTTGLEDLFCNQSCSWTVYIQESLVLYI